MLKPEMISAVDAPVRSANTSMTFKPWGCPRCGTTDSTLAYRSGKIKRCKDCQRYHNLLANANKSRKHGYTPVVEMSHEEFLAWARSSARCCHYCGIDEKHLVLLEQKSSIGLTVEALGIDRLDNAANYSVKNIAWCCYACNKVKSNVFSEEEMRLIGIAIGDTWRTRLKSLGIVLV